MIPGDGGQSTSADPAEPAATMTAPSADEARSAQAAESQPAAAARPGPAGGRGAAFRRAISRNWVGHLVLLVAYEGAGIAATWPRFTYLADGKLPATSDVSAFVWNLWWVAHQLVHPGNPFFTRYMAAPVGIHLAFSTLMPLAGWLMAPVTVLYGPSASFTLLTIITPGLLCYAMYRSARLWLNQPGAIVAGAFFGLSSMLLWQNWYHVNIAIGTIFLPLTIEAAVRFRRDPRLAPAIGLGLALGASLLINQESTAVAVILALVILLPWLAWALVRDRPLLWRAIRPLAIAAFVGLVVASPELIAMIQQIGAGGASPSPGQLASNYAQFSVSLPTLFAPSPRLGNFGLGGLTSAYSYYNAEQVLEGLPTFGVVLSGLALLGLLAGWRKRSTWAFLALWLVSAVFALGTSLTIGTNCQISQGINNLPGRVYGKTCHQYLPLLTHLAAAKVSYKGGPPGGIWKPVLASNLMPYTWLTRVSLLAGLREADRFAIVGLIGAAMLAGLAVQWLSRRKVTIPLIAVVVALGALEAGWSGASPASAGYHGTMATTFPKLERILAQAHSNSIVVDVPYGLRGGLDVTGAEISPQALLVATQDQQPRAISYTAWVSRSAIAAVARHAFYRNLYAAEKSQRITARQLRLSRQDLRTLGVGYVIMWRNMWTLFHPILRWGHVNKYLTAVGFRHVKEACRVHSAKGVQCPTLESVWLYQYEPGRSGGTG
jgi:hypothetical protein